METVPRNQKISVAFYSVLVGLFLTGMKAIVGISTGSLGIISEALHSLLDLGAALMTFFSVRISSRPADLRHQFGHGKVENISALFESLLLLLTCLWIVYEAMQRLFLKTVSIEVGFWSYFVMGVALILDLIISRVLYAGAKQYGSQALEADALHYSSDIFSSLVVIAGLIGVNLGIPILDPIAALSVAVLVVRASIKLGIRAVNELLDQAPAGLTEKVEKLVRSIPGVEGVSQVRLRKSGNSIFVDIVITTARLIPLNQADKLTDLIEREIKNLIPDSDIMIHVNPSPEGEILPDQIRKIVQRFPEIKDIHNISYYRNADDQKIFLSFHIKLSPSFSLTKAHDLSEKIEKALKEELPMVAEIATHLETDYPEFQGEARDLTGENLETLQEKILQNKTVKGIHNVQLHTDSGGKSLSCHILLEENLSLEEAHRVSMEVEEEIRGLFPDLTKVIVHPEPFELSPKEQ
ncbi:MAG: cation-efflux pump [Caldiserica bacterium]|jgi:cation diffusion facilitator family transporter|nr:cation-efflux pump [Caldisericota bacterium]MDH7562949.1 cation diffusion facilitator family transporter [Caldisericota bacterium]